MRQVAKTFHDNLQRVEELGGLHFALTSLTTPALDPSDLLRAQIVLGVSALDHYVHELTVRGMLEVYDGNRPQTDAFAKFDVPLVALTGSSPIRLNRAAFEDVVRQRHSFLSFQQPDKIADAVRLFSSTQLWPSVAAKLGTDAQQAKNRLRLIVDRRNKIAHEADMDPSYPGTRWPITSPDVQSTIGTIKQICQAIHSVV